MDGWMDGMDGISPDKSISRSPSGDKNTAKLYGDALVYPQS